MMKHCPSCYHLFQLLSFDVDSRPVLCLNCGWQGPEDDLLEMTADEWRAARLHLVFIATTMGVPVSGFGLLTARLPEPACDPAIVVDAKGE
jgi:hypothetical protein